MKIEALPLGGAAVIHVEPFRDQRGLFARFFCQQELAALLGARTIKQVNLSHTVRRGTVRGLHFQRSPNAEMKLVRCLRGEIFDVLVDIRRDSPTFFPIRDTSTSLRWPSCCFFRMNPCG